MPGLDLTALSAAIDDPDYPQDRVAAAFVNIAEQIQAAVVGMDYTSLSAIPSHINTIHDDLVSAHSAHVLVVLGIGSTANGVLTGLASDLDGVHTSVGTVVTALAGAKTALDTLHNGNITDVINSLVTITATLTAAIGGGDNATIATIPDLITAQKDLLVTANGVLAGQITAVDTQHTNLAAANATLATKGTAVGTEGTTLTAAISAIDYSAITAQELALANLSATVTGDVAGVSITPVSDLASEMIGYADATAAICVPAAMIRWRMPQYNGSQQPHLSTVS